MRNRSVGLLRVGKKSQPCTAAQEHGVFHGIDEVRGFRLRDVTDFGPEFPLGEFSDIRAVQGRIAFVPFKEPQHIFQKRRLSRAVAAEDRQNAAAVKRKIDVGQHAAVVPIAVGGVMNFKLHGGL